MTKSTIPVHEPLRTKKLRQARAKLWQKRDLPHGVWSYALEHLAPAYSSSSVTLAIGSRRKNRRGVTIANVTEVHYEAAAAPDKNGDLRQYAIVSLADRRVVLLELYIWQSAPREVALTQCYATVSHDLENLWWYAVPQHARDQFARAGGRK